MFTLSQHERNILQSAENAQRRENSGNRYKRDNSAQNQRKENVIDTDIKLALAF